MPIGARAARALLAPAHPAKWDELVL